MEITNSLVGIITNRIGRKDGKIRAKEHRERKKMYIIKLEKEIKELKEKMKTLEIENNQLKRTKKRSIGTNIESLMQKLESESQYASEMLPGMIKNDPEKVRFTMLDQTMDNIGSYGNYRIQLIKNGFKIIIENIVDDKIKAIAAGLNNMSLAKLVDKMKPQTPGKDKYKRFKVSEENEFVKNIEGINFSEGMMKLSMQLGNEIKNEIENLK